MASSVELLSVQQMAEELGIPAMTLYKKRQTGDFPASYKIGGAVRVRREDFLAWLESKREVA
ncbi:helix-turn-helix transcriptional regulator [Rhodococcus aetherivorans]|uniref:helix-turn-helix transcriptional regulator n=1 Tax=Rhodococcus aetherivorans TaxID=191292 RepID=UPI00241D8EE9|nr:helix-turn-helix domain-containing protein [Rhodococcus aetherivorans]WFS13808.1 helix-turn-helix domain-containing protein [Rhodococcus aetherivorans]